MNGYSEIRTRWMYILPMPSLRMDWYALLMLKSGRLLKVRLPFDFPNGEVMWRN